MLSLLFDRFQVAVRRWPVGIAKSTNHGNGYLRVSDGFACTRFSYGFYQLRHRTMSRLGPIISGRFWRPLAVNTELISAIIANQSCNYSIQMIGDMLLVRYVVNILTGNRNQVHIFDSIDTVTLYLWRHPVTEMKNRSRKLNVKIIMQCGNKEH